jgi:COMPASS component SPP1
MAPSKKKKGTAATVKAPTNRARPGAGGSKKSKGGGSKKAKTDTSAKQADIAPDAADGDGNSSESDNGPYCLCRGPDDHRFMIACDRCEDWFHGECIGMDKHTGENLVQKYICPNCTDGGRYTTRYKKMCSFAGCANPARIYDSARPSIFCSPEHCQAWWEQLIATLPRSKAVSSGTDHLTQEEFMGLIDAPSPPSSQDDDDAAWRLGKPPFETPPNFWDLPTSSSALTPEEQSLLTTSAAARYQLGEEIVLCKKMLQLIDMALKQREAAIAAGKGSAKDLCGYDARLDTVGATHQFALFLQSPQGEAIFKSGRLDGPLPADSTTTTTNGTTTTTTTTTNGTNPSGSDPAPPPPGGTSDADYPHMCPKKKCKPHGGWSALLTKTVRHDMKELAAQAKEMLDAEQRVRDGAAGRFQRRMKERNRVVVFSGNAMEVDS